MQPCSRLANFRLFPMATSLQPDVRESSDFDSRATAFRPKGLCVKAKRAYPGSHEMRASEALVIEAAKSWQRLQQAKEFFFADLAEQIKENHRRFLDILMLEERQRFLQAHPYQRHEQRVDQANGFYGRSLTTRLGVLDLQMPRSRSGAFRPRVLPRYERREAVVDEALRKVFLCGVSTRQGWSGAAEAFYTKFVTLPYFNKARPWVALI